MWGVRARRGDWSRELLQAAWDAISEQPAGDVEELCPEPGGVFLIEYQGRAQVGGADPAERDGFRLGVRGSRGRGRGGGHGVQPLQGHRPDAERQRPFSATSASTSRRCFSPGCRAYPVERHPVDQRHPGLAAMDSRHAGHARVETDWLQVEYEVVQRAALAADRSASHRRVDRSLGALRGPAGMDHDSLRSRRVRYFRGLPPRAGTNQQRVGPFCTPSQTKERGHAHKHPCFANRDDRRRPAAGGGSLGRRPRAPRSVRKS